MMNYAGTVVNWRGLVVSEDEMNWMIYPENPVLIPDHFPIPGTKTCHTALLQRNDAH